MNKKISQVKYELKNLHYRVYHAEKQLDKLLVVKALLSDTDVKTDIIKDAMEEALTEFLNRPVDHTNSLKRIYNHTKKI